VADAAALWALAAGDEAAFAKLIEAEAPRLLRFCRLMLGSLEEAEDVVQDAFIRLWENAASWQAQAQVGAWLHTVCHNRAIDRLRRRRAFVEESALDNVADASPSSESLLARRESIAAVRRAVAALPHRQRAAILLFHFQEFSQAEAAQVLDISEEAFESLLSRGRRRLRKALAGTGAGNE
jgi:RNA polymerase sigma-70 factor (ECF subfamily)